MAPLQAYAWLHLEQRMMQQPLEAAWIALTRAEQANRPMAECVQLYDAYLTELDKYVEWHRRRIVQASLPQTV